MQRLEELLLRSRSVQVQQPLAVHNNHVLCLIYFSANLICWLLVSYCLPSCFYCTSHMRLSLTTAVPACAGVEIGRCVGRAAFRGASFECSLMQFTNCICLGRMKKVGVAAPYERNV
jgi:hypothetical protein